MEALSRSSSEVQLHLFQNGITDIDPESISFKVEGPTLNRHKKNVDFQFQIVEMLCHYEISSFVPLQILPLSLDVSLSIDL